MITNSTKYALKALLYLAAESDGDYMQVEQLSKCTGVPGPYLSKLIKELAQQGIVKTKRGALGGVRLKKKDMSLLEICKALGDPIVDADCFLNATACDNEAPCPFHNEWGDLRGRFLKFLGRSTLAKYSVELRKLLE